MWDSPSTTPYRTVTLGACSPVIQPPNSVSAATIRTSGNPRRLGTPASWRAENSRSSPPTESSTRIGAGKGLRGRVEKLLMPITSRLGFRTEFPFERYADWAAANGSVELVERSPLPPLGHFELLRFRKN